MKKIICIIFLFAFVMVSHAQVATIYGKPDQTYFQYTPDFQLTSNTVRYLEFISANDHYMAHSLTVVLDTTGLAANHTSVAVALEGKVSSHMADWTAIGSAVTWKRTTTDTVINILNETEEHYTRFKVKFTGSTGATHGSTVKNVELKLFYGNP